MRGVVLHRRAPRFTSACVTVSKCAARPTGVGEARRAGTKTLTDCLFPRGREEAEGRQQAGAVCQPAAEARLWEKRQNRGCASVQQLLTIAFCTEGTPTAR